MSKTRTGLLVGCLAVMCAPVPTWAGDLVVTGISPANNALSAAIGFKLNVVENLLVDFNLLFNLDNNGLRDKVTPLVGVEYAF